MEEEEEEEAEGAAEAACGLLSVAPPGLVEEEAALALPVALVGVAFRSVAVEVVAALALAMGEGMEGVLVQGVPAVCLVEVLEVALVVALEAALVVALEVVKAVF